MNMTDDEEGNDDDNSYGGPAEYFAVGRLRQLGVELLEPRSQPATQITAIMVSSFESGIQTGW